jgi:hypothetical protein
MIIFILSISKTYLFTKTIKYINSILLFNFAFIFIKIKKFFEKGLSKCVEKERRRKKEFQGSAN